MENKNAKYNRLHEASGFKKGDKVKVIGRAENYQFGWGCIYAPDMSNAINDGITYTIGKSDSNLGFQLKGGGAGNEYWYPFFCLEQAEAEQDDDFELDKADEVDEAEDVELDASEEPAKPAAVFRFE